MPCNKGDSVGTQPRASVVDTSQWPQCGLLGPGQSAKASHLLTSLRFLS